MREKVRSARTYGWTTSLRPHHEAAAPATPFVRSGHIDGHLRQPTRSTRPRNRDSHASAASGPHRRPRSLRTDGSEWGDSSTSSVHVARRDAEALREWGEIAFGEGLPRSSASEWSEIQGRQKGVRNFASGTSESLREDLLRVPAESKISASVAKVLSEEVLSFRTEASGASVRGPGPRFARRPNVGEWGRVEARNMAHAGCFQEEKG